MPSSYATLSDAELYRLLRSAHRDGAFHELYRRYGQRVYVYCRKILFNTQEAEDALQDTFLKLLTTAQHERVMTNLAAYILTIARNVCMDMLRQRRSYVELDDVHMPRIDRSVESSEINQLITMALELLPLEWREAVILQLYANLSYAEIAEALGVPLTTVRNWIVRGKQRLREILQPYFAEPTANKPSK